MRIRRSGGDDRLDRSLEAAGCELVDDESATLVHVVEAIGDLEGFTPAVVAWASAAREAVAADADVITILGAEGLDTDDPATAMLGHGMVAATRALAFELDRKGGRVNLIAVGDADADAVAATVRWLEAAPVTGETVDLGAARHGRLPV